MEGGKIWKQLTLLPRKYPTKMYCWYIKAEMQYNYAKPLASREVFFFLKQREKICLKTTCQQRGFHSSICRASMELSRCCYQQGGESCRCFPCSSTSAACSHPHSLTSLWHNEQCSPCSSSGGVRTCGGKIIKGEKGATTNCFFHRLHTQRPCFMMTPRCSTSNSGSTSRLCTGLVAYPAPTSTSCCAVQCNNGGKMGAPAKLKGGGVHVRGCS